MESCILVILVVCCTLFMCVVVVAGTMLKVSNDATSAIEQTTDRLTGTARAATDTSKAEVGNVRRGVSVTTDTFQSLLDTQIENAANIAPSTGIGDTHNPSFVQSMLKTLYNWFITSGQTTLPEYKGIPGTRSFK
jgi:hypothetical protein